MSSMGVMFGSALTCVLALFLTIYSRDPRVILKTALALLPNAIYMLVYLAMR